MQKELGNEPEDEAKKRAHTTIPVLRKRGDNRDYIEKGLTPYSLTERILIPQLYVLRKYPL